MPSPSKPMMPTTSEAGTWPTSSMRPRGATETSYERKISTVELWMMVSTADRFSTCSSKRTTASAGAGAGGVERSNGGAAEARSSGGSELVSEPLVGRELAVGRWLTVGRWLVVGRSDEAPAAVGAGKRDVRFSRRGDGGSEARLREGKSDAERLRIFAGDSGAGTMSLCVRSGGPDAERAAIGLPSLFSGRTEGRRGGREGLARPPLGRREAARVSNVGAEGDAEAEVGLGAAGSAEVADP